MEGAEIRRGNMPVNGNASNTDFLLRKEDSILVIIDMQERLVPVMDNRDTLIKNVRTLARFSRLIGIPVVVTEQEKLGSTIPEIQEELKGTSPIPKVEFNCFGCKAFDTLIKDQGKRDLVLAGIEAHICVAQTALYALSSYRVHVVGDAISSRSSDNRMVALERMGLAGVIPSSTEMFIFELLGKAGTDTFREALKLVK
ncbi:MAG: hydrolase [Deltaproteobacteria bacterium]|nr:hydrolase [Deltaproteobacteria bacterium]